ncbi:MAG: NAD(P)H-binding protein [Actinomycetia bacterium]|nr:NAD(P)H-binding protein [Actinomycetes bacterium]
MRIAVTGANGAVGGLVVDLLADDHEVVAVTRRPRAAGACAATALADYDDLPALRRALDNVDVLVFVSSDGAAARVLNQHANVVRAASDAQVSHVVYLSGLDADLDSPFCYAYTNGWTERLLAESSLPTSVARASIFTEFFIARFVAPARESGTVRLPTGTGRVSLVAQADVARCLAALAVSPVGEDPHAITGPDSVDVREVAEVVSRTGTPMHSADISPTEFDAELARAGEDPWWTYAFSSMFASIRMHRWAATADAVATLTGRAPLTLSDVLKLRGAQASA